MSESHWWYLFHKEVKSWDSTTWFRIWQFQTPAETLYLQMHLLAERFVFRGWWSWFFERGCKDLSNGTNMQPLHSPTFFCLHIYIVYGFITSVELKTWRPISFLLVWGYSWSARKNDKKNGAWNAAIKGRNPRGAGAQKTGTCPDGKIKCDPGIAGVYITISSES